MPLGTIVRTTGLTNRRPGGNDTPGSGGLENGTNKSGGPSVEPHAARSGVVDTDLFPTRRCPGRTRTPGEGRCGTHPLHPNARFFSGNRLFDPVAPSGRQRSRRPPARAFRPGHETFRGPRTARRRWSCLARAKIVPSRRGRLSPDAIRDGRVSVNDQPAAAAMGLVPFGSALAQPAALLEDEGTGAAGNADYMGASAAGGPARAKPCAGLA